MVILGLDPSTSCTGWSVFDGNRLVAYGKIKTHGDDWRDKIKYETMEIAALLREYCPNIIVAEEVPLKDGKPTIVKLGAVHGMILSLSAGFKIDAKFMLPSSWRREVGLFDGTRDGMKRDVMKQKAVAMANQLFNLDLSWVSATSSKNDDDTAEAIMIAWAYIKKGQNHTK